MWSAGESSWTDGSQQDQQEVGDPGLLNAQPEGRVHPGPIGTPLGFGDRKSVV